MIIGIDFDGTIVEHEFPAIGRPVPGAIDAMLAFQEAGAQLVLWTMRSGEHLDEALDYCRGHGVEFWGINRNPEQHTWTESPKAYCQLYIDDAAFGTPLTRDPYSGKRPYVDWLFITPVVLRQLGVGA